MEEERLENEMDLQDNNEDTPEDIDIPDLEQTSTHHAHVQSMTTQNSPQTFSIETIRPILQSLNPQQLQVYYYIRDWCCYIDFCGWCSYTCLRAV